MGGASVWVGSMLGLRYVLWGWQHADGVRGCAMAWAWDRCRPAVAVDGAWGLVVGILGQQGGWGHHSKNPMMPERENFLFKLSVKITGWWPGGHVWATPCS